MIGEISIPEKEAEAIKVTLDEIEIAIESLGFIKDISMKVSKVNSLISKMIGDAKGVKEAAAGMDETMGTALKSMKFLYGIMKMNGLREMSGSMKKVSDVNAPLTTNELQNMNGKPIWCVGYGISLWFIITVADEPYEGEDVRPFWAYEPNGNFWSYENYGKEWLAYRRKVTLA